MSRRDPSLLFWAKVLKNGPVPTAQPALGPCWVWQGKHDKDGYGCFQVSLGSNRQRYVRAHRFSFELEYRRAARGVLRHRCDNPTCVRPGHLVEGTQADNRADTVARGREPRGTAKVNAVLTEALVRDARARAAEGQTVAAVARERGVKFGTLYQAVRGVTWKHV